MSSTVEAPEEWVASVGNLSLPEWADRRLQELMDRNNDGLLAGDEIAEMKSLVEWGERISLLRAEALHLLGKKPQ